MTEQVAMANAVEAAVRKALQSMTLETIKKSDFFGMKQPSPITQKLAA
ncbi:hypothetical protein AQS8620_01287 [Aquimixticola soesokkakensis]|uniref:Uncharacterized protein n=1 Tax=Aquimixticola soesokkakensis TaxID=1519096 RepID=A0A1Y5SBG8_9RHOB|nr:hypothetical protein [Aquimixticola soesokkakensis]SLN36185.1 hypothetical protein AQS8620_01287 [Aquimixticola soesokkakensis]